jgi:hypothetical protein
MQIIVPTGEVAYPFVFKPQPPMAGSTNKDPSYQLVIVYDEDDKRLDKLKKAIEDVAVAKFGAKAKKMLESGQLKSPLRKGEGRADWLEGKLTMTARSTDKPEVVDRDLEEIIRTSDFYSGCRARMDVYLYAFDKAGNKGVSAILNSAQKMGEGERKSGARPAQDAYSNAEDDEDDSMM